jgi:DNA topoisomerase-1
VKHGKTNATIPKDRDWQSLSLEDAVTLLAERAARGPGKRRGAPRKSAALVKKVVKKAPRKRAS